MKKYKLPIYILIQVCLIFLAIIVFSTTGNLASAVSGSAIYETVAPYIQNLYILQSILVFAPFLIVMGLIIFEIISITRERKLQKEQALKARQEKTVDQTQVSEESEQEKEEKLRQQKEALAAKLDQCLREAMASVDSDNEKKISEKILGCISRVYEITQGEIFLRKKDENEDRLLLSATYAFYVPEEKVFEFQMGEGLIGQVAKAAQPLYLNELPQGYIVVKSGLGSATPEHLLLIPILDKEGDVYGVIELASFKPFDKHDIGILENMGAKTIEFYEKKK